MSRTAPFHAAAAIYSEGDFIYLQLRATKGYTQELSFPATPGGMAALMRVLREREMAGALTPHRIAGPTMPIQYVVDSWNKSAPNAADKLSRAKERADKERFAAKSTKEKIADLSALFDNPDFDF